MPVRALNERKMALQNNGFNEGLGKRMKADRAVFRPAKSRVAFVAMIGLATAVLALVFVSKKWIGF